MSQDTKPRPYVPLGRGIIDPHDPRYLFDQLNAIAQSLNTLVLLCPQVATKAPHPPQETMIRYAKAPWRPVSGQTADAWVTYVNGAWAYLKDV